MRGAPGLQLGVSKAPGSRDAAVHGLFVLGSGSLPGGGFKAGEWHNLQLNLTGVSLSGW